MSIIIETCPNCGHDLMNEIICTNPPIPKKGCPNCGWSWEGEQEEVIRIPFGGNGLVEFFTKSANAFCAFAIGMLVPAPATHPPGHPIPSMRQPFFLPAFASVNIFLHSARPSACSIFTSVPG